MKKIFQALCLAIVTFMASQCFATTFDKSDTLQQAILKLHSTDCSKDLMDCRYYSAIEYVAFTNACMSSFKDKFNTDVPLKDTEKVKKSLENWKSISEPQMHAAVLSPDNILEHVLEKDTLVYLKKLPSDDYGIECSRIALIEQNKNPEEMSDILQGTLNYTDWMKGIEENQ